MILGGKSIDLKTEGKEKQSLKDWTQGFSYYLNLLNLAS